jgi:integrase
LQNGLLSKGQIDAVSGYLARTRWPTRNRVIFLLSIKTGLRAKEIASLTWRMVSDARGYIGHAIHLEDTANKGEGSGRSHRQASKPTRHQQREALARREAGEALTDIGRTFGVSRTTIGRFR